MPVSKNITFTLDEKKLPKLSAAQRSALGKAKLDVSDIPELDASFFALADALMPGKKRSITLRLDEEVVRWLKAQGPGYQSRINAMLKASMLIQKNHPQR